MGAVTIPLQFLGAAFTVQLLVVLLSSVYGLGRSPAGYLPTVAAGFLLSIGAWYTTLIALGQVVG